MDPFLGDLVNDDEEFREEYTLIINEMFPLV